MAEEDHELADDDLDDAGDVAEDGEDGGELAGGKRGAGEDNDYEAKRRKRLELNRKAAQESRRRKKLRIEELQRSVVFLTRENNELREQNELLRQMLAAEMPTESTSAIDRFQAENAALKLALYESVQNLAKQKTIAGIPLAAAGAAAGLPAGAATSGAAASTAMAAAMAAVSSSQGTLTSASEPSQQAILSAAGLAPGVAPGQGHGLSLLANQGLMQLVNSAGQPVRGMAGLPPGANATATMQLARQIAAQQAQLAPGAAGAVNGSAQQQLMNSLAQQGSLASQVAGAAAASAAAQNQQILSAAGLEDPNAKKADS